MADPLPMKVCNNAACAGNGTEVRTDLENCIMCDKPLTRPISDLLSGFGLDDLLGYGKKGR